MKARAMKVARTMNGWSQLDLSKAVGCSEAIISKIETGRVAPDRELKERIAQALKINTWEVGA